MFWKQDGKPRILIDLYPFCKNQPRKVYLPSGAVFFAMGSRGKQNQLRSLFSLSALQKRM